MAQVVTCNLGNIDLLTIGRSGRATEALAEGRRRLEEATDDEAKAGIQAAIDIIKAKASPPLHALG